MGKSSALLAATAVVSLPRAAFAEQGLPTPVSHAAKAPLSLTWSPLVVPRGGGENVDDHVGQGTNQPGEKQTNDNNNSSKKKRRRKRTSKKEQDASSFSAAGTDDHQEETTTTQQENEKVPPPADTHGKHEQAKSETPETLPVVEEILKEEDFYRILGITKAQVQSNPGVIKKSYRRRALQTHPDKTNGDRRAFDKVAEAYEILSDDEKRKIYDRHGKKGLHGAGPGHGFPTAEDLFRSFFGGGPGRGPFPQPRRNRTVRYQLEVTLEDLYKGMTRNVSIASPDGRATAKEVQVNVPRGALSGQPIRLHGAMDFDPDDTPGDLIFLLNQRPHRRFTRKGHDLAVAMTIGLDEALNGVTRTLRHLDGHSLTIASARQAGKQAQMIQTGDVHVLKGQGMPKNAMGTEFGDLYVQYQVELPKPSVAASRLTPEERQQLGTLIRKLEGRVEEATPSSGVQYLEPARASDFGTASGQPEIPRDEYEEEEHFHTDPFGSPFGRGRSSFYFSSGGGPSPFFGMNPEDFFRGAAPSDDENVQCRQM